TFKTVSTELPCPSGIVPFIRDGLEYLPRINIGSSAQLTPPKPSPGGPNGDPVARLALRHANAHQEPRLHDCRRDYNGTRHRCQHRAVQRRQWRAAEIAALQRPRPA